MVYPGTHLERYGQKPAIVMDQSGETLTYAQLEDRSIRLAHALRDRGLRRGDVIALLAENHIRYFEVYWAALRSGLYLTPVNRYLAPDEVLYQVRDSGAKALISTARMAPTAHAVIPDVPECAIRLMMDGTVGGFDSYEDALAKASKVQSEPMPRGDALIYSSGTTGRPKAVKRQLQDVDLSSPQSRGTGVFEEAVLGMSGESVYLCPAPLYHSAGLQWSAGAHDLGATLVIMEKFDPERWLAVIEREHVTHTQVVPTMFVRVLKLPEAVRSKYDLSSLQCVLHAAAPCPIEVKRQMIAWLGPIIDEFYAGTEGSGLTFIRTRDWLEHPGSVGRPMLGVPHICDDDGNELPTGSPGLLYFEQDVAPFEYHGDPQKTRASRHPVHENWTAIGDVAYVDHDGFVYLTDRKSFMIISGGVNIYPAEIEACLIMHEKVLDVAVFGLPDPEMGELVQAVVQLVEGVEATPELKGDLLRFAREHLAGYKVPRSLDFSDELPRLPTGKLVKGPLRDEYLKALT
jgi:acyl-CoA synthetase (AMP-forming)/AMP-acid ligase II